MARRRRRRPPGGHTTAAGSGGRRAPFSTDTDTHTHTARSLACPLLTLSSAPPFSNGIFKSDGAPASLPPASSSLTHTRRMDGFCNQNADQLGSLAGLSFPAVYVGVVDCAKSGKGKGKGKGGGGGQGGAAGVVGGEGEGAAGSTGLVRVVLKAADMLQAEGLLKHCPPV